MKYSCNKVNISRKTNRITSISYNCYNTYCMGRANAIISYSKIDKKYTINIKQFIIRNKHSIDYNNHVFIINQKINSDIKNNNIDTNSLKNICYARAYFINVINNNIYTQLNKIEIDFIKKYGIKEINTRNNDSIKIPVKKVIASASIFNKRSKELKEFAFKCITNLKDYDNNNIVEELTVEFMRNNLKKNDKIYLIITNNMRKNLINIKPQQIFIDCTYKVIPPGLKKYKFFVIIGFDNNNNKLILYLFALIRHENIENFETIFKYLKIKYEFIPKYVYTDYQKGQIKAIAKVFPNANIILCWFHALKNIKAKLPFLNSKNTIEKKVSKDILSNIKLMFFIPEKYIEKFFQAIKAKYYSLSYKEFYAYSNKYIYKKLDGKKFLWNYNKLINNKIMNENQYFITNNFIERTNRTLNENLFYKKSSYSNFRNTILNTDYYFETKTTYNFAFPNLSKSLIYYITNCKYFDKNKKNVKLIDYKILHDIYSTYVKNLD